MGSKVSGVSAAHAKGKRPGGRRPGESTTRDAILDAARTLFAERGYEGASVRAIATAAKVDPALIRHFFRDKATLFTATVAEGTVIPDRLLATLDGDPTDVGRRFVDAYLRLWEEPDTRPVMQAVLRSATTSPAAAEMLATILQGRIRSQMGDDDALVLRLSLVGSHMLGIALARYVVQVPAIAQLDHDSLVDQIAPTIQRYVTGEHR